MGGHSKSCSKKPKENEDPNKLENTAPKKYKYFSKKNKSHNESKHKPYSSGKTVEVFLFENKTAKVETAKKILKERSPLNKSVENICKKYKTKYDSHFSTFSSSKYTPSGTKKKSNSKPKICLPVYQKYINQVKKVATSSKLKELHKKMHSSIMNSFVSTKEMNNSGLSTSKKSNEKFGSFKASSSFVFPSKSPLRT